MIVLQNFRFFHLYPDILQFDWFFATHWLLSAVSCWCCCKDHLVKLTLSRSWNECTWMINDGKRLRFTSFLGADRMMSHLPSCLPSLSSKYFSPVYWNIFSVAAVLGMGGGMLVGGIPGVPMVQGVPGVQQLGLIGMPRFRWPDNSLTTAATAELAARAAAGGASTNLLAHPLLSHHQQQGAGVFLLPRLP